MKFSDWHVETAVNPALHGDKCVRSEPLNVTVECALFSSEERNLCLANCYAGRFYVLYESELSLTFGTNLVVGKRSDRGSALRSGAGVWAEGTRQ